jgi:hypothetical protein
MPHELKPTADPKKIVDTLRMRLRDTPSNELNHFVRECLRIARTQGRRERRGVPLCSDPNHTDPWFQEKTKVGRP